MILLSVKDKVEVQPTRLTMRTMNSRFYIIHSKFYLKLEIKYLISMDLKVNLGKSDSYTSFGTYGLDFAPKLSLAGGKFLDFCTSPPV